VIAVEHLSKRYGDKLAVDDLSFTVRPGIVTGFLGPNGAGKSTTMRLILGLDAPTSGTATVAGRAYRDLPAPLHEVGAMLEARAIHTGRSAFHHLLAMAQTHGIPRSRVDEVIELVGLQQVARKRVGSFSLGMGQRLGIAAALLGDPATVILDEPANGLDPEGILWIRNLLKGLAAEGRTVFLAHDERDRADGRAAHRRRARPPDRRHVGRRHRRGGVDRRVRARPHPAGGRPA
jgi:ABC-2 type transport system ATP-binding protein